MWAFDFPWFQFLKMLKPKNCRLYFLKKKIRIKELPILGISKTQRNCRFNERTSIE